MTIKNSRFNFSNKEDADASSLLFFLTMSVGKDIIKTDTPQGEGIRGDFMKLINIGFGNLINADRVVAVVSPDSAPAKRMIQECRERAQLVDATHGRKTKGVIITDSDNVVLSFLSAEQLFARFNDQKGGRDFGFEE